MSIGFLPETPTKKKLKKIKIKIEIAPVFEFLVYSRIQWVYTDVPVLMSRCADARPTHLKSFKARIRLTTQSPDALEWVACYTTRGISTTGLVCIYWRSWSIIPSMSANDISTHGRDIVFTTFLCASPMEPARPSRWCPRSTGFSLPHTSAASSAQCAPFSSESGRGAPCQSWWPRIPDSVLDPAWQKCRWIWSAWCLKFRWNVEYVFVCLHIRFNSNNLIWQLLF